MRGSCLDVSLNSFILFFLMYSDRNPGDNGNTVEPLSNDHPHQRPSLLHDHISCDVVGAAHHI